MIEAAWWTGLAPIPMCAVAGVVLGKIAAHLHERFDEWRMERHRARAREAALLEQYGGMSTLGSRSFADPERLPMATYADALRDAVMRAPSADDYDRMLRATLKADAELRSLTPAGALSRRITHGQVTAGQWQSSSVTITNGPGGTKVRQSYDASGNPVPSFTLDDFMHLKPAPEPTVIPPPPPGTPFDWRTDPRFAETIAKMSPAELALLPGPIANTRAPEQDAAERDAVLERAEKHQAYLARTLKLKVEKRRAEEAHRARAPHEWRCDKCGYTETLTDDEVAIRADGVGDLWTAHWPAKAQGDAADVLCDGRVLRIGGGRL